ncbi:sensor histidine kinase [Conyzicola nivalis]|uniref:histidine kinase n=1 Tax=Conyzicola nivalis TaxID=1477021 RepID=A0A916WD99_9MICO|nr:ATP-binding protein [Conyzicola nivalis]GGA90287.1 two-component sensor histidine kinase [Conyzicola nivalis]
MKLYHWVLDTIRVDKASTFLKQGPFALAFLGAVLIVMVSPNIDFTVWPAALLGMWGVLVATALAAVISYQPTLVRLAILVPVLDLVALSAFRAGTGGNLSPFSSLIILPVIWIAAEPGRRYIIIAGVGTAIALTDILGFSPAATSGDLLRSIFAPIVFAIGAAIVNEVSRQGRVQVESVRRLAEERESMLRGAEDYTKRLRENEAQLRAADKLTRSVLDAVTEQSVVGTDVTGSIDVWNPGAERMLGLTAAEAQRKRFIYDFHVAAELDERSRELNYPPGETVLTPGFSALVESARLGTPEVRQWTYVRADGLQLAVEVAVTRRVNDFGETAGYLFVATDVTQALEVSRLKDEFVGLISHELRTPLSSILGYLELMRDDADDPLSEEQMMYLGIAERNAHRLLRLMGDLLFTAQVGANSFNIERSEVDVAPVVLASIESANPVAVAQGVTIVAEVDDDFALVSGDPTRIGQAIDNLLSNAIKFTPRGGNVTVAVSCDGSDIVVRLTDTGMGIPANELDQLFSRFFRASTATRAAVPGVGLGLTITKAIIDAHGGSLDVESEVGVGTTFIVRLPKVTAAVEPA